MTPRHRAGFAFAALLVMGMSVALGVIASPVAAAPTKGCGKTATVASGQRSIETSGKSRSYILRLPDNYDSNHAYRLIFGFHPRGGVANDIDGGGAGWSYYGLKALSGNSAIFIAPQGFNNGWANAGGEDVTFVDDMIRKIKADLCVDTSRVFATGFSFGGGMSYALACSRATVFRAVAVYAGGRISGCDGGTQPIAYLGLHGTRDGVLNISLGRSLRDTFVRNNGCTPQNPPEPAQGSLTHIVTAYSGCRSGYPVVWAAFDGGHTDQPADGSPDDWTGERTWTRAVVWNFFAQFKSTQARPAATTPPPTTKASPSARASATPSLSASFTGPPAPADTTPSTAAALPSAKLAAGDAGSGGGRTATIAASFVLAAGVTAVATAFVMYRRRFARHGKARPIRRQPAARLDGQR